MPTPNTNSVGVGLHEFRQSLPCDKILCGAMAARLTSNQKVTGSSPVMEKNLSLLCLFIIPMLLLTSCSCRSGNKRSTACMLLLLASPSVLRLQKQTTAACDPQSCLVSIDTSNDEPTTVGVAPLLGDAIMEKTNIVLSARVSSKAALVLMELVDDEDVGIL